MVKRPRKTTIVTGGNPNLGQMAPQPQPQPVPLPQPAYASVSSPTAEMSTGIMERPVGITCGICGAGGEDHSAMGCLIATCPFKWD